MICLHRTPLRCSTLVSLTLRSQRNVVSRMVRMKIRGVTRIRSFARNVRMRWVVVERDRERPSCLIDTLQVQSAERFRLACCEAPAVVTHARKDLFPHASTSTTVLGCNRSTSPFQRVLGSLAPFKHNKGSNVATPHRVICFPARCLASRRRIKCNVHKGAALHLQR